MADPGETCLLLLLVVILQLCAGSDERTECCFSNIRTLSVFRNRALSKLCVYRHNHRAEVVALRKTKKEWEACGTVVTSLCTMVSTDMGEIGARVEKVSIPDC